MRPHREIADPGVQSGKVLWQGIWGDNLGPRVSDPATLPKAGEARSASPNSCPVQPASRVVNHSALSTGASKETTDRDAVDPSGSTAVQPRAARARTPRPQDGAGYRLRIRDDRHRLRQGVRQGQRIVPHALSPPPPTTR